MLRDLMESQLLAVSMRRTSAVVASDVVMPDGADLDRDKTEDREKVTMTSRNKAAVKTRAKTKRETNNSLSREDPSTTVTTVASDVAVPRAEASTTAREDSIADRPLTTTVKKTKIAR